VPCRGGEEKETYSDFYGSCGGSSNNSGGGSWATLFLKRAAFLDTPSPRHGMLWVDVQQGGGRVVKWLTSLDVCFSLGAIEEENYVLDLLLW
jgi:hypothetical protein